jgi:BolA protein
LAAPAPDRRSRIEALLREQLAALHVDVIDESHLHAGHAGAAGGAGHYRALVVSQRFEGKGLIERQRLVYAALGGMMNGEIHALALRTLTPEQWQADASRG